MKALLIGLLLGILTGCQTREGKEVHAPNDDSWLGLPVGVGYDWNDAKKRFVTSGADCRLAAGVDTCGAMRASLRVIERDVYVTIVSWGGSPVSSIILTIPRPAVARSQEDACVETVRKLSEAFRGHGWTLGAAVLDRSLPETPRVTVDGVAVLDGGKRDRVVHISCVSGKQGDASAAAVIEDAWTALSLPWRYPSDVAATFMTPREAVQRALLVAANPIRNGMPPSEIPEWIALPQSALQLAFRAAPEDALSPRSRDAFHLFGRAVMKSDWFAMRAGEVAKTERVSPDLEELDVKGHDVSERPTPEWATTDNPGAPAPRPATPAIRYAVAELCQALDTLSQLDQLERRQERVDAASGTINPTERRQNATVRIYLEDQRETLARRLANAGVRFERRTHCGAR